KFNGKELQNELNLNLYDYGARNYDPALGRFHVMDPLSDLAPMHTPYRFGFNNPVYWRDPTGLIEFGWDDDGNVTSIKTSNQDEINAIMGFFKDNEGASLNDLEAFVFGSMDADEGIFALELEGATITGKSKESNTLDYAGAANDAVGLGGDILNKHTKYKGGSFAVWNGPTGRSFDGIKTNELKFRYSPTNKGFNQYTGKGIKVAKVVKKGSIVATAVLGTIEVGQGVAQDYENYQNTGSTDGKNTAVATTKVVVGIGVGWAAGAATGALIGSSVPIVGTVVGAIVGGVVGYYAGEAAGEMVEQAYE
ncbi:RHS repeat-associated core domain-containing protein, partial [Weeksella sp. HMSC059D05]|uniref:RHS repeat-associated core domain-containing protein n=1 Tax=Weeksella sp. HMSC059D05 TaxID=1715139 RepID=UPI000AF8E597